MSTPTANLPLFLEHVFPLDPPFRGLVLFTGHASVLRLSQLLSLQYVRRGHPVVLVDGVQRDFWKIDETRLERVLQRAMAQ